MKMRVNDPYLTLIRCLRLALPAESVEKNKHRHNARDGGPQGPYVCKWNYIRQNNLFRTCVHMYGVH